MHYYIFLAAVGENCKLDGDINFMDNNNIKVIGIEKGHNQEEAFNNLIANNSSLFDMDFKETVCYQLADNYEESKKHFNLRISM